MTRLRRFFAGDGDCLDGDKIVLYGEFAHISRVLRMKAGDRLIVCFNDGRDCECEIESFDKDCVRLKILSVSCCAAENDVGVTLFQGLIKGERMDWCLQKAVELGADEIRPFVGRNTVAEADFKKIERFNRIAKEASKQCGRAFVTEVKEAVRLRELPRFFGDFDLVLLCNEHESQKTLSDALDGRLQLTRVAVIVGSEGGFETEEINLLVDAGAVSISLGRRVLRAETAGLYALSVLNERLNNRKI